MMELTGIPLPPLVFGFKLSAYFIRLGMPSPAGVAIVPVISGWLAISSAVKAEFRQEEKVALTVRVRIALPVPPAFVAPIVTLLVPVAVGVPEITPVAEFTVSPAGRPVAL